MVGRWAGWITLYGLLLLNTLATCEDCWETCFNELERGQQSAEYEHLIGLIQSFKKAMMTDANTGVGTSNGTAILLDTTLPDGTDRIDSDYVQSIQKGIGQILALSMPMLTNFNPGFLVKYNDKSAWTCDNWQCLGRCEMFDVLQHEASNFSTPEAFSTRDSSTTSTHDLLDDSCEMASITASNSICSGSSQNVFAVAIVNSNFKTIDSDYTNLDESVLSSGLDILSEFDFQSSDSSYKDEFNFYCDKHFPKKAAIGTYFASADALANFPSASTFDWPGYTQIPFSKAMKEATERISSCMQTKCCSNRQSTYAPSKSGTCHTFTNGQSTHYYV